MKGRKNHNGSAKEENFTFKFQEDAFHSGNVGNVAIYFQGQVMLPHALKKNGHFCDEQVVFSTYFGGVPIKGKTL